MLIVLTALALLRYELPPSVCYGHVRSSDWTFEAGSGNAACWDTSGVLVLLARTSAPAERPERFLVLFFGFAQQLSVAMAAQLKAAREVQSADKRDEPDGSGDRSDDDPSGARLWNEWLANFAPRGNGDPVPASETNSEPNTAATEIETETDHTYSHGTDDTEAETTHDETPETTETTEATETSEKPLDDNVVALGFKCEAGALAVLTLSQSPYNFEFPLNSRSLLSVDEASSRPAHTMDVDLFVAIMSFLPVALLMTALSSTRQLTSMPLVKLCHATVSPDSVSPLSAIDQECFESTRGIVLLVQENDYDSYDLIAMIGGQDFMADTLGDLLIGLANFDEAMGAPMFLRQDDTRFVFVYDKWMALLRALRRIERRVLAIGVEMPAGMDVPSVIALVSGHINFGVYISLRRARRRVEMIDAFIRRLLQAADVVMLVRFMFDQQMEAQDLTVQPLGALRRKRRRSFDDGLGPVKPRPPGETIDEPDPPAPVFLSYWNEFVPLVGPEVSPDSDDLGDIPSWPGPLAYFNVDDISNDYFDTDDDSSDRSNDIDMVDELEEEVDVDMTPHTDEEGWPPLCYWQPDVSPPSGVVDDAILLIEAGEGDFAPNDFVTVGHEPCLIVDGVDEDMIDEEEDEEENEDEVAEVVMDEQMEEEEEEPVVNPVDVSYFFWNDAWASTDLTVVDNSVERGAIAASAVSDVPFSHWVDSGAPSLIDPEVDNDATVSTIGAQKRTFDLDGRTFSLDPVLPDDPFVLVSSASSDFMLGVDPVEAADQEGNDDDFEWDGAGGVPSGSGGAGGAGTEMWQLHQANQPPICAYELTFNMPPGSTVATPLSSFLAAPAAPNGIAPPAPLAGPFAAMARCAQSGFYMYLVECTAAAPAGFGLVGFDNCASLHSPAAAAAAAAGATTEFVIAFVGRTEEQLAEQYRQHRKEINGANARSAKGVAWRAWFESRRSFFVGFPAVDSLATALQMMLLRPYIPGGSSGFKFPLNDDSSWPGLLPPSTISLAASINYPSLLKYREHMLVGCAGIAGGAANQQFTAVAALAVHHAATVALAWPGGLTCPAGAMVAWAPPALQRGAPGPRWTDLGSFGAPTFIGDAIPLPGQFAFDGVPFGAAPHKVALTATEWHTVINGALLALEGTRQMIGAALP